MPRRRKSTAQIHARREECLRPSRYLGHEHNALAAHLFERGAYSLAEAEWRRAVWLNPFEAVFKANLACCLFKQQKLAEARKWAEEAIALEPDGRELIDRLAPLLQRNLAETHEKVDSIPGDPDSSERDA